MITEEFWKRIMEGADGALVAPLRCDARRDRRHVLLNETYMGVPIRELHLHPSTIAEPDDVVQFIMQKAKGDLVPRMMPGRETPYTEAGIRRLPCVRCGDPAHATWQVCADARWHRPICKQCDIDLNAMVLHWMGDPDADQKMRLYRSENG